MDCQFSFGPNRSFFCKTQDSWAWGNKQTIPPRLLRILQDPNHQQAMRIPYDVAFPMEPGTWLMSWKTIRGDDWYENECLGPSYSRLAQFMHTLATTNQHTTRTVFGPGASYFSMSTTGYNWQYLPPALEVDLQRSIRTRWPTCVALGAQGSYVVLYTDGTVTFDLRGLYPAVDALIRDTRETSRRRGVMFIALNPFFLGEYYVAYGDGSAGWNLPSAWSADVTTVSRTLRPVAASAPPASPASTASHGMTGPAAVATGGTGPTAVGGTSPLPPLPVSAPPIQVVIGGTSGGTSAASPASVGGTSAGSAGGTRPSIMSVASAGGTRPSSSISTMSGLSRPSSMSASVASGGVSRPSSVATGGSVGHVIQAASTTISYSTSPVQINAAQLAAQNIASSPGPSTPSPPPPQTFGLQQGIDLGLKAAAGLNQVLSVFNPTEQPDEETYPSEPPPSFSESQAFSFAEFHSGMFEQQPANVDASA